MGDKASKLGLRSTDPWTEEEVEWLIANYPEKGRCYCAEYLGKSDASIRQKTSRLKLKQNRDSEFFKDWQSRAAESKVGKKRPDQALVMKKLHEDGKLICTDQKRAKLSAIATERIQKNGHPRGLLGKTHTSQVKAASSKRFEAMWKDPASKCNSEEFKQRQSDLMQARQKDPNSGVRRGYSRGKQGKRKDLDDRYFRSSWEANYARYLNFLVKNGDLYKWDYEVDTFFFEAIKRGTRSYMPDFKIWEDKDCEPYYIEVKGWMDDKSKTKLSRMAKYFPQIKIVLVQKKEYMEIQRKMRGLIPSWE